MQEGPEGERPGDASHEALLAFVGARIREARKRAKLRQSDLAKAIGSAPRAVGGACGDNPFPIVVPCHRVVAQGKQFNEGLGGFAHSRDGLHMDIKRWLLQHEKTHARG